MTALPSRPATAALALAAACFGTPPLEAQQVADSAFQPPIEQPAWPAGRGPVLLLDEAHANFHTAGGRYLPFVRLVERDGFVVVPSRERFTEAVLAKGRILVIANALADSAAWVLPARPAFTVEEVAAVERWVRGGGALLLIADHMPFPGAAQRLGRAFGLEFLDGFALRNGGGDGPDRFRREDGSLADHPITRGRSPAERVDSVATFTGQAFRATVPAAPLLVLDSTWSVLLPHRAWVFSDSTPRTGGAGLLQGAALRHGRGRVVVFGEAAMFSAQRAGPNRNPMGMNHPEAAGNPRLLLNILHWLAGHLEPDRSR